MKKERDREVLKKCDGGGYREGDDVNVTREYLDHVRAPVKARRPIWDNKPDPVVSS